MNVNCWFVVRAANARLKHDSMGERNCAREVGITRLLCTLATCCCLSVLICVLKQAVHVCGPYGVTLSEQGQLLLQGPATGAVEKSPNAAAKARRRVALVTVGFAPHEIKPHMHYMYWTSVASKKAYAAAHDYPLYIVSQRLSDRTPMWGKIIAIKAAMQHSEAEWLWCTDSDAYIMNQNIKIETVIHKALAGHPNASVIMSKDCNGLQTGSFLVRNTPWLQQHLSQAWFNYNNKDSDAQELMSAFGEQGAFAWLYRVDPVVRQHYQIVPQRSLNSYPDVATCADEFGYFKDGDLLIHFPGDFKKPGLLTAELFMAYMNKVPISTLLKYTIPPDSLPGLLSLVGASKYNQDQALHTQNLDTAGTPEDYHSTTLQSATDAAAAALAQVDIYTLTASTIDVCKNATSELHGKQTVIKHHMPQADYVWQSKLRRAAQLAAYNLKLGRRQSKAALLRAHQQVQRGVQSPDHSMKTSILVTMATAAAHDGHKTVPELFCVSIQRASQDVQGDNVGWPVAMPMLLEQLLQTLKLSLPRKQI